MKLNKTPKYATALLCALAMASAVPTISVYAAQDTYSTFSTGKKTARMRMPRRAYSSHLNNRILESWPVCAPTPW